MWHLTENFLRRCDCEYGVAYLMCLLLSWSHQSPTSAQGHSHILWDWCIRTSLTYRVTAKLCLGINSNSALSTGRWDLLVELVSMPLLVSESTQSKQSKGKLLNVNTQGILPFCVVVEHEKLRTNMKNVPHSEK